MNTKTKIDNLEKLRKQFDDFKAKFELHYKIEEQEYVVSSINISVKLFLLDEKFDLVPFVSERSSTNSFKLNCLPKFVWYYFPNIPDVGVLAKINEIEFLSRTFDVEPIFVMPMEEFHNTIRQLFSVQELSEKDIIISGISRHEDSKTEMEYMRRFFYHYASFYFSSIYHKKPH